MKEIYLKASSNFPYIDTDVPLEKSIEDIKKLLKKFECKDILTFERGEDEIKIAFKDKADTPYLIEFPQVFIEKRYSEHGRWATKPERAMQISGRIIFNEIKAMLVNVEVGYLSFMQAMLRYVALPSPEHGLVTLGDVVEAQKDKLALGAGIEFDPQKLKLLKSSVEQQN